MRFRINIIIIEKEIGGVMEFLSKLGINEINSGVSTGTKWFDGVTSGIIESFSPVDGKIIAKVKACSESEFNLVVESGLNAFDKWRCVPAPKRGEIVRQIGMKLRENKNELGMLVSYEMGKSLQEGLGEVQEMIDICDFAVGLSRQLYGFTMHSERENHRMYDQYHPLGITGIITAFNFPVAVWAWNAMISCVCGNVNVWKPSSKVPLSAVAVQNIISEVLHQNRVPEGVFSLVIGSGKIVGEKILDSHSIPLVSITGSVSIGRYAASKVAQRFGKTILELGGNNAIIITPSADLKIAVPSVVFGAVGTCGQRCTSTRRLIIHESVYDKVKNSLLSAYKSLQIGNPLNENNHLGPLIDKEAVNDFISAIITIKEQGGKITYGGEILRGAGFESGCYVLPVIAEVFQEIPIVKEETFAPILYLIKYSGSIQNAVKIQNSVNQGLSSAIFSNDIRETEYFLSAEGSDCGIANVNIGTSGAEIGGAFGGEKETGGGRESGSDAWKVYMRRQTNTINYGKSLPLAQGINFNV